MFVILQFSTTNAWISRLIRTATWWDYSHVDLVLPDRRLLGAHLEDGVQIRQPDYVKFSTVMRLGVEVSADVASKVYALAMAKVGKPYDLGAIFAISAHRDWRENDKWFCSEAVADDFEKAGYPLLNPICPVSRVSPRDLMLSPLLVGGQF